ncbi:MAG: hypothetical protein OXI24_03895 [Candidatus Poribacteria bacterium]|nr:hypothetical protein [Candidatus Poribacteria bacterium]
MKSSKVADLTIDEFSELMQKVVIQTLSKIIGDPDKGLELRGDFAEELKQSLADMEAGGKTVPMQQIAEKLGILQSAKNNTTQLSDDKFEALADELADEFMEYVGPDCPPLSNYAVTREGLYEDHL